jgi:redox-sensitive bicupin YhaK (pirin superfamily)
MHGFQLWANLPSALKMTAPRYQEVKALDIPEITDDDGTHVRVVCGKFWGKSGPVDGIAAEPIYLDVSISPGKERRSRWKRPAHALRLRFCGKRQVLQRVGPTRRADEAVKWLDTAPPMEADNNRSLIVFDRGDEVTVQAGATEFDSFWCLGNLWKSRWRGTAPSS